MLLLGDGAVGEEEVGAAAVFVPEAVLGFGLGDGGLLFGFVDLEEDLAFFDGFALGHADGGDFALHLGFEVDRLFRVEGSGGAKGFQKGADFHGHQFHGNRGVFGRSSPSFFAGGQDEKAQKDHEMLHFMNV